jgi:hypothetical protein
MYRLQCKKNDIQDPRCRWHIHNHIVITLSQINSRPSMHMAIGTTKDLYNIIGTTNKKDAEKFCNWFVTIIFLCNYFFPY